MFKFDNVFFIKAKKVGIQFIDPTTKDAKGEARKATVYPDEKGRIKVDFSFGDARQNEYVHLVQEYNRRNTWYYKGK